MDITIGIIIFMVLIPVIIVAATRIMQQRCEGQD